MNVGNCLLVECPYCGKSKELIQLISGNTFSATSWSDARSIYPMLPEASPVQKCPHCGKYYFKRDARETDGEKVSYDEGWLSFEEAAEALEALKDSCTATGDYELLVIMVVWGYNDMYRKNKVPSEQQYGAFCGIVRGALEDGLFCDNVLLKAELYREIGMFGKCIGILDDFDSDDDYLKEVCGKIRRMAEKRDVRVFRLTES